MRSRFVFLIAAIALTAEADDLIISEAMVNEPGQMVSLEWIELHLPASATHEAHLIDYRIYVDGEEVTVAQPVNFRPGDYLVMCRQMYLDNGRPGFESVWGDNSGVWGDHDGEQFRLIEVRNLALTNTGGCISLVRDDSIRCTFSWNTEGGDGVSWERALVSVDSVQPCYDPSGSTPGHVNSTAPRIVDLALELTAVHRLGDSDRVIFRVESFGNDTVTVPLTLTDRSDGLVVASKAVALITDNVATVDFALQMRRPYRMLECRLPDDVTPEDNRVGLQLPGNPFPAVIMTELMAAPTEGLTTEWIELYNRTDDTIVATGWRLADPHRDAPIPDSILLAPHSFIIVAQDSIAFKSYYIDFAGPLVQPAGWPSLNNDADTIMLSDQWSFELDRAIYLDPPDHNRTLVRALADPSCTSWLPSLEPTGSPGRAGGGFNTRTGDVVAVRLSSRYIDVAGGGQVGILLAYPDATAFSLRIYDRNGRVVRTLLDGESIIPDETTWDGCDDGGRRLPIGPYVVFFDVAGVGTAKEVVVVAR